MNNDDWQVGDLAVCLYGGPWRECSRPFARVAGPNKGEVCRVQFVHGENIHLLEWPHREGWEAIAFRKIKPDAEPCEEEFTTLIKRGARKPVRV